MHIDGDRSAVASHLHAIRNLGRVVNRNDLPGAEERGAANRELADRAAAPDRHGIVTLNVALLDGHISGRENVRQKDKLVIVELFRHFLQVHVAQWHAQELGLPARVPPRKVRIAKHAGCRLAEHCFAEVRLRVRILAAAPQLSTAEKALAAAHKKWNRHAVADLHFVSVDARAEFLDDAHRLVAEDIAGLHKRDEAVDQVQVGAADTRRGYANDGVARVNDFWIGDVFDLHHIGSAPNRGFHDSSFWPGAWLWG
jgi:hypothetical protein